MPPCARRSARRVDLPSGGYLVFDYAEAFTVIDVNTGRFVGARGKGSGARLEDTITKNNLEATKRDRPSAAAARHRRDHRHRLHRHGEPEEPRRRSRRRCELELERDRTKTYVVEISPLGLVEMTRQNVTDGPREILTTRCPVCEGNGIVVSEETYAVEAERRLRRLGRRRRASEAFLVELAVGGSRDSHRPGRLAAGRDRARDGQAVRVRDARRPTRRPLRGAGREGTAAEIEPQALPVGARR